MICRPDLSARQCRSTNRTCILTPEKTPNRPDSKNLLQCKRFFSSRADTFKEAGASIKIMRKDHAYSAYKTLRSNQNGGRYEDSRIQRREVSKREKSPCWLGSELSTHVSMKKELKIIMIGTREIAKTQISNSLNELLDTKTAPLKQSSVSQKL